MGIFDRLLQHLFNKHMINYKDEVKCWGDLKSDLKKVLKEKEDDKMKLAKKMVGMAISGIEKVITKHRKDELSDKDKEKGLKDLNRFRSDKDGKFDEKTFYERLLEGFWLC